MTKVTLHIRDVFSDSDNTACGINVRSLGSNNVWDTLEGWDLLLKDEEYCEKCKEL